MFTVSNFDEVKEFIQNVFNERFEIIDKHNCSSGIHFTVDNHPFCVMFSRSEYNLWAHDGSTSLYEGRYDYKDGLSEEVFSHIKEEITHWLNGYIRCDDCGKLIKKEDIGGWFFAGAYCKDCWEREWKEREAHENYD